MSPAGRCTPFGLGSGVVESCPTRVTRGLALLGDIRWQLRLVRPRTLATGQSPSPIPAPNGQPELKLAIEDREQLAWSTAIAKKYILKDNDWRRSIRNQGVMTEVWLSAVTLVHEDETASVTVPVTSEGSSRLVACHDILGVRSADVPYTRDDRWAALAGAIIE